MRYIFELPLETKTRCFENRAKALTFAQRLCSLYGAPVRMSKKGNKHGHIIEKI